MSSIPTAPEAKVSGQLSSGVNALSVDSLGLNVKDVFELFLRDFELSVPSSASSRSRDVSEGAPASSKVYVEQALRMSDTGRTCLYVDFAHVSDYATDLLQTIRTNYYRLEPFLCSAVESFVRGAAPDHDALRHRLSSFHVGFYNIPSTSSIRELKTNRLGHLMTIGGTVTRTSQVRPELTLGTFVCLECGTVNRNVRQQFKYTEPTVCVNAACANRLTWSLDATESHFADFQLVKIQENSSEIPPGSMPRSIKVIVRHELVEQCKPGDKCIFTGHLIVVPDVGAYTRRIADSVKFDKSSTKRVGEGIAGMKGAGNIREVNYSLCFVANSVRALNAANAMFHSDSTAPSTSAAAADGDDAHRITDNFTLEEKERIQEMRSLPRLFSRLTQSIAPNIFGHEEIKRGMLLMLLGGVHKVTRDRANLRGDINVCIVGDPSTSKSQFLKYVCSFSSRAVYTSGKASSAAGLTASVVRDAETGEFGIEAGALMLADNGICCIDEFDKMEISDQVAIHEAMEQQTISIAKAGIQATLNARTSVLAAANPIRGRYDKSKTLKQNVDISAPIMSRFDLFFVVLDDQDEAVDYNLARHIVDVHCHKREAIEAEFSLKDLQNYVRFARAIKPQISPEAQKIFVENYLNLRANDSVGVNKIAYRITVRQLESLIRLSEARARVDLSPFVLPAHVKQAAELLKMSIVKVESGDVDLGVLEDVDADLADESYDPAYHAAEDASGQPPAAPKASSASSVDEAGRVELRYDDYQRICLLLVRHLRGLEVMGKAPLTFGEVMEFYLSQAQSNGEIATDVELAHHVKLIRLVLIRLIDIDRVLQVVKTKPKQRELLKKILVVHPNFAEDSDAVQTTRKSRDAEQDAERESSEAAAVAPVRDRAKAPVVPSATPAAGTAESDPFGFDE